MFWASNTTLIIINSINWVEIKTIETEIDKVIISGNFQIQLTIDSLLGKAFEWSPDTLLFLNGEFVTFEK